MNALQSIFNRKVAAALIFTLVSATLASNYANAASSSAVFGVDGTYIGQDPDPGVRLQLKIDAEHHD